MRDMLSAAERKIELCRNAGRGHVLHRFPAISLKLHFDICSQLTAFGPIKFLAIVRMPESRLTAVGVSTNGFDFPIQSKLYVDIRSTTKSKCCHGIVSIPSTFGRRRWWNRMLVRPRVMRGNGM